jgi:hypothetical protein
MRGSGRRPRSCAYVTSPPPCSQPSLPICRTARLRPSLSSVSSSEPPTPKLQRPSSASPPGSTHALPGAEAPTPLPHGPGAGRAARRPGRAPRRRRGGAARGRRAGDGVDGGQPPAGTGPAACWARAGIRQHGGVVGPRRAIPVGGQAGGGAEEEGGLDRGIAAAAAEARGVGGRGSGEEARQHRLPAGPDWPVGSAGQGEGGRRGPPAPPPPAGGAGGFGPVHSGRWFDRSGGVGAAAGRPAGTVRRAAVRVTARTALRVSV